MKRHAFSLNFPLLTSRSGFCMLLYLSLYSIPDVSNAVREFSKAMDEKNFLSQASNNDSVKCCYNDYEQFLLSDKNVAFRSIQWDKKSGMQNLTDDIIWSAIQSQRGNSRVCVIAGREYLSNHACILRQHFGYTVHSPCQSPCILFSKYFRLEHNSKN